MAATVYEGDLTTQPVILSRAKDPEAPANTSALRGSFARLRKTQKESKLVSSS